MYLVTSGGGVVLRSPRLLESLLNELRIDHWGACPDVEEEVVGDLPTPGRSPRCISGMLSLGVRLVRAEVLQRVALAATNRWTTSRLTSSEPGLTV